MHICHSIELISLIWVSLERRAEMTPTLVKGDDIRSGTKAKACHGRLQVAWESMG